MVTESIQIMGCMQLILNTTEALESRVDSTYDEMHDSVITVVNNKLAPLSVNESF
jgi:hypothetical protein